MRYRTSYPRRIDTANHVHTIARRHGFGLRGNDMGRIGSPWRNE